MLIEKLKWHRIPDQIGLKAYNIKTDTTYEVFRCYDSETNVLIIKRNYSLQNGELDNEAQHFYFQKEAKHKAQELNVQKHLEMFPEDYGIKKTEEAEEPEFVFPEEVI
tara:strand:- start:1122 stop:1445 length:324 start_codon:yes stop_codon:yes gene_type:complete